MRAVVAFFRSIAVAAFGLVTSLLTVILVTLISAATGFNVFTFSLWVVIPVGAVLTGLVAASGYYFGSRWLSHPPSFLLLAQIILIAAATYLLIYFVEYLGAEYDNGTAVADAMSFVDFMRISLGDQEIAIGHHIGGEGMALGAFGYAFAVLDFVGFLAGGVGIFLFLRRMPYCKTCSKYHKQVGERTRYFAGMQDAAHYYDGLFALDPGGPEFSHQARIGATGPMNANIAVKTTLLRCPKCRTQVWRDEVLERHDQDWRANATPPRELEVPATHNLAEILKGPSTSPPEPQAASA